MKFNEGYLFENGIVISKEMNYKTCLVFGEHTISSGDLVCVWTTEGATIVGTVYCIDRDCIRVRLSKDDTLSINKSYIKGIAKKIDGKWVSMREEK